MTRTTPFRAVHPSEVIKDEIKARSLTQKELAERMGMQQSNLSRLLKGENITASTAQKLEEALDIPADFWMRLQTQYDKDVKAVAQRDDNEKAAVVAERMLANTLNLPALYKRLKINSALFIQDKLASLEELLGFKPLEIGNHSFAQQPCYKKSDKFEVDEKNQTTWLTLAYIESRKNACGNCYEPGNAKAAAQQISKRVHEGGLREVEINLILAQHAITYSVVEKLEKTPIDAVSMDIDGSPAIITTHRYDDMSRLIFDVMHELGHIELHMYNGSGSVFINDETSYSTDSQLEIEANKFAQDLLISPELWDKMMDEGARNLRMSSIVENLRRLSEKNNLDFNIVAWRYKHESRNYNISGTKAARIK